MTMTEPETTSFVLDLMTNFAERTGLVGERAPTRYLWTDAFAVCDFLELERRTGEARYIRWAVELADTAVERFTSRAPSGDLQPMAWKMSIDLSRPLVASQGHHDPLDGLVTCLDLRHAAKRAGAPAAAVLDRRIADLAPLTENQPLATADPLGNGGLLTAAHTLAQLIDAGASGAGASGANGSGYGDLLVSLLSEARPGLAFQIENREMLSLPVDSRLAFRELGLSLGLRAARRTEGLVERNPHAFASIPSLGPTLERLQPYLRLIAAIEPFWREPENRRTPTWKEHQDINAVMLATSLAPDGFLALDR